MSKEEILKKDMETINKIVKKEINANDLSQEEITRLTAICKTQIGNLERRISFREDKVTDLEIKIDKMKNVVVEE